MDAAQKKRSGRERRHNRIRKHVSGSGERPRLAVFRSNRGIYAQVIDDAKGHTLAAASTQDADLQAPDGQGESKGKIGASHAVGKLLAQRALAAGVSKVVFDRGGNRYHGRVKALAEGAREGGLEF